MTEDEILAALLVADQEAEKYGLPFRLDPIEIEFLTCFLADRRKINRFISRLGQDRHAELVAAVQKLLERRSN